MINIIIPFYNEEEIIKHYGDIFFPIIENIEKDYQIKFKYTFINDGSKDDTYNELIKLKKIYKNINVISYIKNKGMGGALKEGIKGCNENYIITMDSDLTFRPNDIRTLINELNKTSADCISGSPYLQKNLLKEVDFFRLLLSKTVNLFFRILLNEKISCVSPIFRLYKTDCLKSLDIRSNNFEINAEILAKLIISKKTIVEVPVELHKREFGNSKINISKEMNNYFRLAKNIIKVKYFNKEWK